MICGKEPPSKSSNTVPVCRQVRSSKRLCKDSVDTWGLLQRSPPSSTFSSNFIHLEREGWGLAWPLPSGGAPSWACSGEGCWLAGHALCTVGALAHRSLAEGLLGTRPSLLLMWPCSGHAQGKGAAENDQKWVSRLFFFFPFIYFLIGG